MRNKFVYFLSFLLVFSLFSNVSAQEVQQPNTQVMAPANSTTDTTIKEESQVVPAAKKATEPAVAAEVTQTAPVIAEPSPLAPVASKIGEEALKILKDGNLRYVSGTSTYPHEDAQRRLETAENGQKPIVSILSCADSRAPIETIFDQGIGDIFNIRVAGNVADTDEIGTIEYGVGHLGTPLLVVLGHTRCGAVTAVCTKAEVQGSIPQLVDNIIPAVNKAQAVFPSLQGNELAAEAVKFNVWQSVEDIFRRSAEVRELAKEGKLTVVGAVYDIATGQVDWLGQHPEQMNLLESSDVKEEAKNEE